MIRIVKALIVAIALTTAPEFAITFELDPQQTTLDMTFGATLHRVDGSPWPARNARRLAGRISD